jgi:hypothetical protein
MTAIKNILLIIFLLPLVCAGKPQFKIEADSDGIVTEVNGDEGDRYSGSYSHDKNGGYSMSFTAIVGVGGSDKPQRTMDQIPIIYRNEVYGGITEVGEKTKVYVTALHLFRFEPKTLSVETRNKLNRFVPLLVKKSAFEYFDIVIFVDRARLAEFDNSDLTGFLKEVLVSDEVTRDGRSWVSPHQVGKQDLQTASQFSRGVIEKVVTEYVGGRSFNHFYLANSEFNYSSKASSGSIIHDAEKAIPLGVLQCQINRDFFYRGTLQKSKGLFRILSFDILNQFDLEKLNSLNELFTIGKRLLPDPVCDWRDGKMGGGN